MLAKQIKNDYFLMKLKTAASNGRLKLSDKNPKRAGSPDVHHLSDENLRLTEASPQLSYKHMESF